MLQFEKLKSWATETIYLDQSVNKICLSK
jgi:hypothetical protein